MVFLLRCSIIVGNLWPDIHVDATLLNPSTPNTHSDQWYPLQHRHTLMPLVQLAGHCVLPHHKICSGTAQGMWQRVDLKIPHIQIWVSICGAGLKFEICEGQIVDQTWLLCVETQTRDLHPFSPVGCKVAAMDWIFSSKTNWIEIWGIWSHGHRLSCAHVTAFLCSFGGVCCPAGCPLPSEMRG